MQAHLTTSNHQRGEPSLASRVNTPYTNRARKTFVGLRNAVWLAWSVDSSLLPNMHPRMHVRRAAEIPEHRRPFDLPHIPDTVIADVVVFVKRHVQFIETVRVDQFHRFFHVA